MPKLSQIIDLNMKPKTANLGRENWRKSCELGLGKNFLHKISRR